MRHSIGAGRSVKFYISGQHTLLELLAEELVVHTTPHDHLFHIIGLSITVFSSGNTVHFNVCNSGSQELEMGVSRGVAGSRIACCQLKRP